MAQESNLGRNALVKTLQLGGVKVSSGSISKILKEWKESRSMSNNDSFIDTTAATTEITEQTSSKSVDEITQSATSDVGFHRSFVAQDQDPQSQQSTSDPSISKSIDNTGSPTSKI